jgi:predicted TIM-barrel fold metal-dependent hydrolase
MPRIWDFHVHFPRGGGPGQARGAATGGPTADPSSSSGHGDGPPPPPDPQAAVDHLAEKLREVGTVKASLLCNGWIAGRPKTPQTLTYEQCRDIAMKHEDLFVLHAVVDPAEQGFNDIERLHRLGYRGLKIIGTRHPYDFRDYYPVYRAAEELAMPILFHCGVVGGGMDLLKRHPRRDPESAKRMREMEEQAAKAREAAARGEPPPEDPMGWRRQGPRETSAMYMRPFHLETLANHFPRLKIVGAHFGGTGNYDEAASVARWRRYVYFDMSGGRTLERHAMERNLIGSEIPIEKLIFGSDCAADEIHEHVERFTQMFEALGLSEEEKDLLWYRNAAEVFGVEPPIWAEE